MLALQWAKMRIRCCKLLDATSEYFMSQGHEDLARHAYNLHRKLFDPSRPKWIPTIKMRYPPDLLEPEKESRSCGEI